MTGIPLKGSLEVLYKCEEDYRGLIISIKILAEGVFHLDRPTGSCPSRPHRTRTTVATD